LWLVGGLAVLGTDHDHPASFSEVLGRTGALYYTVTVFATVGFGDITPTTEGTRIVTMTQMVVGLLAVGLAAKLLVGAVQEAVTRAAAAEWPPSDPRRGRRAPSRSRRAVRGGHARSARLSYWSRQLLGRPAEP
jgi:hypothetical protein